MSSACAIPTDKRIHNNRLDKMRLDKIRSTICDNKIKKKLQAKNKNKYKTDWPQFCLRFIVCRNGQNQFLGLLQFKAYKPKSYLLYGYCITVNIDQHKPKDENYFYYDEPKHTAATRLRVTKATWISSVDLAVWVRVRNLLPGCDSGEFGSIIFTETVIKVFHEWLCF